MKKKVLIMLAPLLIPLFERIDRSFIGRFVSRQQAIIEQSDPNKVTVENVAAFFCFPKPVAKFFCELAVRSGEFKKNNDKTYSLINQKQ